jgi:hypothetical protein
MDIYLGDRSIYLIEGISQIMDFTGINNRNARTLQIFNDLFKFKSAQEKIIVVLLIEYAIQT